MKSNVKNKQFGGTLLGIIIGLVVGLSIWWKKLAADGQNANALTSQKIADMGGGATFYDVLVEVEKMHESIDAQPESAQYSK